MWIFNAIANAVGRNFIGTPNYLFGLLFNRVQADGGVTEAQQCTINELTELQNENLLSSASLVVTPSSYKESKLYSLIPTNGNGDFTFTRATTATRVNSDGLVELVPYNLLSYSEQFDNAAWAKTATTVTANTTTAPNGTLTADKLIETATTSSHVIGNAVGNSIVSGQVYTFSFFAKKSERTFIQLAPSSTTFGSVFVNYNLDNGTISLTGGTIVSSSMESVGDGWYRCIASITATATATTGPANLLLINSGTAPRFQSYLGDGTSGVFIWGAQLVEGSTALPYQKTETRLNIPRLDYSLGGCPNILLEPQRTNLALRSEEFDNVYWTKNASSVTANSVISPSGVQNADTLTANGLLNFHSAMSSVVSVTATPTTLSIYAKKNTNDFIQLAVTGGIGGMYANFDIASGTLGSVGTTTGSNPTSSIQSVGNGWYRCTMTFTPTASTTTNVYFAIAASATDTRLLANTLSTSVYLWGAQLEVGAYATSYIPTTSASVTRNYDIPSLSNVYTNGFISASGGTWYSHLLNNVPRTRDSGGGVGLRLTNVAGNNLFHISTPSGANQRYWIRKIVGGTNTDLYNTMTNEIKVAIKWNGTTADVFVNGVEVVSATAFTSVDLENLNVNNPNIPYSINAMTLFPTPLTDAECIALTTI